MKSSSAVTIMRMEVTFMSILLKIIKFDFENQINLKMSCSSINNESKNFFMGLFSIKVFII
jgi:hypothetical protein